MGNYERTGWRDEALSRRHRVWGFDCPAVDIDFLMLEYDHGKPVALVDYKLHTAVLPSETESSIKAIIALADGYKDGPLPFLIVRYWPNSWAVQVIPMNTIAKKYFKGRPSLTERQYVGTLYRMRNRVLIDTICRNLCDQLPPDDHGSHGAA